MRGQVAPHGLGQLVQARHPLQGGAELGCCGALGEQLDQARVGQARADQLGRCQEGSGLGGDRLRLAPVAAEPGPDGGEDAFARCHQDTLPG